MSEQVQRLSGTEDEGTPHRAQRRKQATAAMVLESPTCEESLPSREQV